MDTVKIEEGDIAPVHDETDLDILGSSMHQLETVGKNRREESFGGQDESMLMG